MIPFQELIFVLCIGLAIGILGTWLALQNAWWTPYMRDKKVWQEASARQTAELNHSRRRLRLLANENEIAERKVELIEFEISRIRRELAQNQTMRQAAEGQLQEVERYVGTVEGQLAEMQKQRDKLRNELRETQQRQLAELADTRIELAQLGVEYETLKQEIEELNGERTKSQQEIERLRQEIAYRQGSHDSTQQQLERLVDERDAANRGLVRMVTVGAELAQLSQSLTQQASQASQRVLSSQETAPASQPIAPPKKAVIFSNSPLRAINGIGPTYAKRLHEAGIETIEQLTYQSSEKLADITQLPEWQKHITQNWLLQAQDLLKQGKSLTDS